ncbi:MAG: oligosaccharide flippase family protein [Bacteroidota bacterium]
MGVIKRQSIKRSIVSYVGTLIGIISVIKIYPLDREVYGYIQWLIGVATFLFPFASLGVNALVIRYFRDFNVDDKQQGYFGFLALWTIGAFLFFTLLAVPFSEELFSFLESLKMKPYFRENQLALLILCFLIIVIQLLIGYISNFNRIVVPTLLSNFTLKIAIPTLVLLHIYIGLTFFQVKWLVIFIYVFIASSLLIYLYLLGGFNLRFKFSVLNKARLQDMSSYAIYGILGSIGSVIAFNIDIVMVAPLTDLESGGVYNIALFIGNAIAIPYAAISGIANPIVSKSWGENDIEEISSLYSRSSKLLFTVGIFLFVLVWLSIDDIFKITGRYDELIIGINVVFFIGIARVIDMTAGVNHAIIAYSTSYRFNLIVVLTLAFSNVFITYALIPIYGISGAAMATAISLFLSNLMKFVFIWIKFKMQPFDFTFLMVLLLAVIAFAVAYFLPSTSISEVNIVLRSAVAGLLFGIPLLYFNLVPDINEAIITVWSTVKKYIIKSK